MMACRSIGYAVAALGLSILLPGEALAEQSWQSYAPRCQTRELAMDAAWRNPCENQLATFGLSGPTVLSRNGMDVEATGSLGRQSRPEPRENDRSRL